MRLVGLECGHTNNNITIFLFANLRFKVVESLVMVKWSNANLLNHDTYR